LDALENGEYWLGVAEWSLLIRDLHDRGHLSDGGYGIEGGPA